uniref:Uncharacterized protein n=1 Tax=Arundo donax TaxID=35708 RepID=A0A0A9FZL7_ARUDO
MRRQQRRIRHLPVARVLPSTVAHGGATPRQARRRRRWVGMGLAAAAGCYSSHEQARGSGSHGRAFNLWCGAAACP